MSAKANAFANLAGGALSALLYFVSTPLYLQALGGQAFGLLGVYATIFGVSMLLDMGLTPALTRELAKLSAEANSAATTRNTVRTLELIYFAISVIALIILYPLAPLLGEYWLNTQSLPKETVDQSLQWMVILLVLQLPIAFYNGGLIGLQRQLILNVVQTSLVSLRLLGGIWVVFYVKSDIVALLFWQCLISAIQLIVSAIILWRFLPTPTESSVAYFDIKILKNIAPYAFHMLGITALSIVLTQLDKIILAKMLPIEQFGYYMIAWTVASLVLKPVAPIFNAWLPRLTQLVQLGQHSELISVYRSGMKLIAWTTLPLAIFLSSFPYWVLTTYTSNPEVANSAALVLTLLSIGNAAHALMNIPYALTLANNWPQLGLYQNLMACILIVPITIYGVNYYGLNGGAMGWCLLNMGYLVFSLPIIHRKYLSQ